MQGSDRVHSCIPTSLLCLLVFGTHIAFYPAGLGADPMIGRGILTKLQTPEMIYEADWAVALSPRPSLRHVRQALAEVFLV